MLYKAGQQNVNADALSRNPVGNNGNNNQNIKHNNDNDDKQNRIYMINDENRRPKRNIKLTPLEEQYRQNIIKKREKGEN